MITDVLVTAVAQIREELSHGDRIIRETQAHGATMRQEEARPKTIDDVVDEMERLARRLLPRTDYVSSR